MIYIRHWSFTKSFCKGYCNQNVWVSSLILDRYSVCSRRYEVSPCLCLDWPFINPKTKSVSTPAQSSFSMDLHSATYREENTSMVSLNTQWLMRKLSIQVFPFCRNSSDWYFVYGEAFPRTGRQSTVTPPLLFTNEWHFYLLWHLLKNLMVYVPL